MTSLHPAGDLGEGRTERRPWGGTHSLTRNGWLTSFSTDFSLCTCCSCFSRMTSGILITFRAKKCLAVLSLTSCTRPNVPVPGGGDGTRGCIRTVKETVSFGAPNPSIWRVRVLTRSAVLEVSGEGTMTHSSTKTIACL